LIIVSLINICKGMLFSLRYDTILGLLPDKRFRLPGLVHPKD
jgi:hypothetical protein